MPPAADDPRLERLVDLVVQIASGDLTARLPPSPAADSIDGVIVGVNMLAEELHLLHSDLEQRVAERTAQLEHAQQELKRLTLVDALTGLANRTLLGDRIEQAVDRSRRGTPPPTLLLLDLDGFKLINDSLGHAAGDTVLVEVARRLQHITRRTDTVARLGGDEFAILLPDTEPDDALRIAERTLAALRPPMPAGDLVNAVGVSVGVRFGAADLTADELLRDADIAMYAAKAKGRNHIKVFAPDMHTPALSRRRAGEALRAALRDGALTLRYQPLVELATGRIVGAEALACWPHPQRGVLPATEFIRVAEQSGLIGELGSWVLGEAVRQLAGWRARLGRSEPFTMHLNISPGQVGADLGSAVRRVLHDHGVPASSLSLELTETGFASLDAAGLQTLAELRADGVGLALDNFGTGRSSLSRLARLPVDTVKIDRTVVGDLHPADRRQADLVRALVAVVDTLGLTAVAVGVETAAQAAQLRAAGCRLAQGYHFGRPVPADELTQLALPARTGRAGPDPCDGMPGLWREHPEPASAPQPRTAAEESRRP